MIEMGRRCLLRFRHWLAAGVLVFAAAGHAAAAPGEPALIPLEYFARPPAISSPSLSPAGGSLAYRVRRDGRERLVMAGLGRDNPVEVVEDADALLGWYVWANDRQLLVSIVETEKYGSTWVGRSRLRAHQRDGLKAWTIAKRLTESEVSGDDLLSVLPSHPDHIVMEVGGNVAQIDITKGRVRTLSRQRNHADKWLVDANGVARVRWGNKGTSFRVDFRESADQSFKTLYRFDAFEDEGPYPLALGAEPHLLMVTAPEEGGRMVLKEYDTRTRQYTRTLFAHPTVDVGGVMLDNLGGRVLGAFALDDDYRLIFFDKAEEARYAAINSLFPNSSNFIVSRSRDMDLSVVAALSGSKSAQYYLLDHRTGVVTHLGSHYPELDTYDLPAPQPIRITARDGLALTGYLTRPKGSGANPVPLVLLPHGGPHSRDLPFFDPLVQFLASRGYAVLQVNYRGSEGFGRDFEKRGYGQWGLAMQDDLTDAVAWAIGQGIADADNVCIVGVSYGGYAAAMAAIKTPHLFACAVSLNGVMDLRRRFRTYFGDETLRPYANDRPSDQSPYHRADEVGVPLLLLHARKDMRVPYFHSRRMAKKLAKLGKPARFVTLEDDFHTLRHEKNILTWFRELEAFLASHLRGKQAEGSGSRLGPHG